MSRIDLPAELPRRRLALHAAGPQAHAEAASTHPVAPDPGPTLEQLAAQVRQKAFAQGLEEGRAAAARELDDAMRAADAALESAKQALEAERGRLQAETARALTALDQIAAQWPEDMVRLAVEIALEGLVRLVPERAVTDTGWLEEYCRHAAGRARPDGRRLRLHPALAAQLSDSPAFVVVADPTLPPGGCMVETPAGDLDASIGLRLGNLLDAALGALGNARS